MTFPIENSKTKNTLHETVNKLPLMRYYVRGSASCMPRLMNYAGSMRSSGQL